MPPFKFDDAQFAGIVAYLRNMNTLDRGALKPGDPARGQSCSRRERRLPELPPRQRKRLAKGPDLSDIGSVRSAGSIEAFVGRSQYSDDADQSSRSHRHA